MWKGADRMTVEGDTFIASISSDDNHGRERWFLRKMNFNAVSLECKWWFLGGGCALLVFCTCRTRIRCKPWGEQEWPYVLTLHVSQSGLQIYETAHFVCFSSANFKSYIILFVAIKNPIGQSLFTLSLFLQFVQNQNMCLMRVLFHIIQIHQQLLHKTSWYLLLSSTPKKH